MNRLCVTVATIFVLAAVASCIVAWSQMQVNFQRSVVAIGSAQTTTVGSGFAIAKRAILTNEHVISDLRRPTVRVAVDGAIRSLPARITYRNAREDVALLILQEDLPLKPLRLLSKPPRSGAEIHSIGFPSSARLIDSSRLDSFRPTVSRGIISRVTSTGQVQHDSAINPGNSGGPLLDQCGRLVGINHGVARRGNTQGISFALSSQRTLALIGGQNVNVRTTGKACRENALDFVSPFTIIFLIGAALSLLLGVLFSGNKRPEQQKQPIDFKPQRAADDPRIKQKPHANQASSRETPPPRKPLPPAKNLKNSDISFGPSPVERSVESLDEGLSEAADHKLPKRPPSPNHSENHETDLVGEIVNGSSPPIESVERQLCARVYSDEKLIANFAVNIGDSDTLTIGRAVDNKLRINVPSVSSHHAMLGLDFRKNEPSAILTDLESTNGTILVRRRNSEVPLGSVDLGMGVHKFDLGGEPIAIQLEILGEDTANQHDDHEVISRVLPDTEYKTRGEIIDPRFSQMLLSSYPTWRLSWFDEKGYPQKAFISAPETGENRYTIGRGECDIRVNARSISRMHAEISIKPKQPPEIRDLGSRNGTFLSSQRLENQFETLYGKHPIVLGTIELTISRDD